MVFQTFFKQRKFTNLFRELDQGTQFLREILLPTLLSEKLSDAILRTVLFKSFVYRLMNKVETSENISSTKIVQKSQGAVERNEDLITGSSHVNLEL